MYPTTPTFYVLVVLPKFITIIVNKKNNISEGFPKIGVICEWEKEKGWENEGWKVKPVWACHYFPTSGSACQKWQPANHGFISTIFFLLLFPLLFFYHGFISTIFSLCFQTNFQFLAKYSLWVENKSICQIFCCTFYWNAISLRFWWFLISGNFDFNQDPLKDCFCYIFTQI